MLRIPKGQVFNAGSPLRREEASLTGMQIPRRGRPEVPYNQGTNIALSIAGIAGKQMRADQALEQEKSDAEITLAYRKEFERNVVENDQNPEEWDSNARAKADEKATEKLSSGNPLTNFLLSPLGDVDEERSSHAKALINRLSGSAQAEIQKGRLRATIRRYQDAGIIQLESLRTELNAIEGAGENAEAAIQDIGSKHLQRLLVKNEALDKSFLPPDKKTELKNKQVVEVFSAVTNRMIEKWPHRAEANAKFVSDLYDEHEISLNLAPQVRRTMVQAAMSRRAELEAFQKDNIGQSSNVLLVAVTDASQVLDKAKGEREISDALGNFRKAIHDARNATHTTVDGDRAYLFKNHQRLDALEKTAMLQVFTPLMHEMITILDKKSADQDADPRNPDKQDNAAKYLADWLVQPNISAMIESLESVAPVVMSRMRFAWNSSVAKESEATAKIQRRIDIKDSESSVANAFTLLEQRFTAKAEEISGLDEHLQRSALTAWLEGDFGSWRRAALVKLTPTLGHDGALEHVNTFTAKLGDHVKNHLKIQDILKISANAGNPGHSLSSLSNVFQAVMGPSRSARRIEYGQETKARIAAEKAKAAKTTQDLFNMVGDTIKKGDRISPALADQLTAAIERQVNAGDILPEQAQHGKTFVKIAQEANNRGDDAREVLRSQVSSSNPIDLKALENARADLVSISSNFVAKERGDYSGLGDDFSPENVAKVERADAQATDRINTLLAGMKNIKGGSDIYNAFSTHIANQIDTIGLLINAARGMGGLTPQQTEKVMDYAGFNKTEAGQEKTNFELALARPKGPERRNLRTFVSTVTPAIPAIIPALKRIVTRDNLRRSQDQGASDIVQSVRFAAQLAESYTSHGRSDDFLNKARTALIFATGQEASKDDVEGFARRLIDAMEDPELQNFFSSQTADQSLQNSIYARATEAGLDVRQVVEDHFNKVFGYFGSLKAIGSMSWDDGARAEIEDIIGHDVIIDDAVNRLRYMLTDPKEAVDAELIGKKLDLIRTRETGNGSWGLTAVHRPIKKRFGLWGGHPEFISEYKLTRWPLELQLPDRLKGVCEGISDKFGGSTNIKRNCLGELSNAMIALNFIKSSGEAFQGGDTDRSLEWLRLQLPASTIGLMFQHVGPNGVKAFLDEANQYTNKYWKSEILHTVADAFKSPRGFGDTDKAPKIPVTAMLGAIPLEFKPSIFSPPGENSDISGVRTVPFGNKAGWRGANGLWPMRDNNGKIVNRVVIMARGVDVPYGVPGELHETSKNIEKRGLAEGVAITSAIKRRTVEFNMSMPSANGKNPDGPGEAFTRSLIELAN